MNVIYIFKKPKFPLIININNYVVSTIEERLEKNLLQAKVKKEESHNILDSTGEGFMLCLTDNGFGVTPITHKKQWTKKEIISAYNNRKNKNNDTPYSEKSLSAKTKQQILKDIIELLKS